MGVLNEAFQLDALALNMLTMIGLALGVDYSLLIVSRFREELAAGRSVEEAVEQSVAASRPHRDLRGHRARRRHAGRVVHRARLAARVRDAGRGRGVRAGRRDRPLRDSRRPRCARRRTWTAGSCWSARRENPWVRLSERMSRKPLVAVLLTMFPLLLLTAPALALDTGPPNVQNLPPDNAARKSFEAFQRDRGAGWATPFEVDFQTQGPITTEARLRALKRFQQQAAGQPGIEAVLGPASLLERTEVLRSLTRQIASGGRQLNRLEGGLERLLFATGLLNRGLERGAAGATALNNGLGEAAGGSNQIAQGTADAVPQTQRLANGVAQTEAGSKRLTKASRRASKGARELQDAIDELARDHQRAERSSRGQADRSGQHVAVRSPVRAAQPRQRGARRRPTRRCNARWPTCSGRSPRSAR